MRTSVTSSGEKTATSQVMVLSGYLHGFELNPPSTGVATLKMYDSASATTNLLIGTATVAAGLNGVYVEFPYPRAINNGIYAVLTGTTTYLIGYSL